MCGQRLAAEVQQVVAKHPSLTTISFIGHSMGGLIARYTIGLLAKPSTRTVAGLHPAHYISIASPHLGCSSSHPGEVSRQAMGLEGMGQRTISKQALYVQPCVQLMLAYALSVPCLCLCECPWSLNRHAG